MAMTSAFYKTWIANTKSPFFRSGTLKDLDRAIEAYCAALALGAVGASQAEDAMVAAWDTWQKSKELNGGWWYSDRNRGAQNGIINFLAQEMAEFIKRKHPRATIDNPLCFDSPHLTRAASVSGTAPIQFNLSMNSIDVWNRSRTSGKRGDTFIGITDRTTGACHMLPTYERCDPPGTRMTDESRVKNRIFVGAPERTVLDIYNTYGRPPRFGNANRNVIIAEQSAEIDGYYHNTLLAIVMVPAANALGWALQGCPAHGGGQFRFVSSKNSGVFDLGNGDGHEGRDLPPAWAKAISDCVASALNLTLDEKFEANVSGRGNATRVRKFTC